MATARTKMQNLDSMSGGHIKEEFISGSEEQVDVEDGQEGMFVKPFLDVLAEVATATLEKEPDTFDSGQPKVKSTNRSLLSLDLLNLSQVRQLSDKQLLKMFVDTTANEMTRNYTCTCYLLPGKCSMQFTSFGNEARARAQVLEHIHQHLRLLRREERDNVGEPFVAEPLAKRRKRLAAEQAYSVRQNSKKGTKNQSRFRSPPSRQGKVRRTSPKSMSPFDSAVSSIEGGREFRSDVGDSGGESVTKTAAMVKRRIAKRMAEKHALKKGQRANVIDIRKPVQEMGIANKKEEGREECPSERVANQINKENEQLITDLLRRSQPNMDHCYTTIFGKKDGIEHMYNKIDDNEDMLDMEEVSSRTACLRANTQEHRDIVFLPSAVVQDRMLSVELGSGLPSAGGNIQVPVIRLTRMADFHEESKIFVESEDQIISLEMIEKPSSDQGHTNRPYPPMPKSDLAKRGKMPIPEEVYISSDEEMQVAQQIGGAAPPEGSLEWERKIAMKYIRELRGKKGEIMEQPLHCKICKDKAFTATATLMYHYRSHAGIKPFVCLICNTTFTRQHSLNYHMLIHNNQSRFTCKECGRKFRHPSHFKEHLRRHTGETPFQCPDCSMYFKTRNTYKRHLKTRHRKLLTAAGITPMNDDDPDSSPTGESVSGDTTNDTDDGQSQLEVMQGHIQHHQGHLNLLSSASVSQGTMYGPGALTQALLHAQKMAQEDVG